MKITNKLFYENRWGGGGEVGCRFLQMKVPKKKGPPYFSTRIASPFVGIMDYVVTTEDRSRVFLITLG